jgi:hypothetical protein
VGNFKKVFKWYRRHQIFLPMGLEWLSAMTENEKMKKSKLPDFTNLTRTT